MKMNLITVCLMLMTLVRSNAQPIDSKTSASDKSFPANFSAEDFSRLKKLDDSVLAYDGVITEIKLSKNNTPFYKLQLEKGIAIWTVLMFENEDNEVNDTIRVVGYLTKPPKKKSENERFLESYDVMVIAFGLVDFKKSNFLFIGDAKKQRQEWLDGKIPSSK